MDTGQHVEALMQIVGDLYASALQPGRLVDALRGITRRIGPGGSAARLCTYDRATGTMLESHAGDDGAGEPSGDALLRWGRLAPPPAARSAGEGIFVPREVRWAAGAVLHFRDGTSSVLAAVRPPDSGPFSPDDTQFLQSLLPHLRRATELRAQLADTLARSSGLDALVRSLPHPCVLLDTHGRTLAIGAHEQDAWQAFDVAFCDAQVRFGCGETQARWLRLLAQVLRSGLPCSMEASGAGGRAFRVQLLPVAMLLPEGEPQVQRLLVAHLEIQGLAGDERLAQAGSAYRLTGAETEVLRLLVEGFSAKQIAFQRRASIHTVRAQLASILGKAGVRSQRELLARLRH